MRRISFSRLLLLVAFVPLIALALFAGSATYENWTRYTTLNQAESLLRVAVAAGRFSMEGLPGEGAASRDFLANGDKAKLAEVRGKVDKLYGDLRAAAAQNAVPDAVIDRNLKALEERIQNQFRAFRAKVDDKSAQPTDVAATLAPISTYGFDIIGRSGAIAGDAEVSRRLFALYATLQFADGVFIQRGLIQRSLQDGQLPTAPMLMFAKGINLEASFKKMFFELAPAATIKIYNDFYAANGKAIDDIKAFVAANAGKPAEASMIARWNDLNRQQSALLSQLGSRTMDIVSAETREMTAAAWRSILIYLAVVFVVLVVVLLTSRAVLLTVRNLLNGLVRTMDQLRDGHYDATVPSLERADEIGQMARATENFRESLVRMRAMEAEQREAETRAVAEKQANAEREAAQQRAAEEKAASDRKAAMHALAGQFETAVAGVINTVSTAATQLEAAASTLSETADVTQRLSGSVAAASEQASANVQSVASATEELTSSVNEISRQVHESSKIAGDAVKQAQVTDARISELSQAAGRIGDVVKLITAIAEQTNLLALNATIEAARAGEAGKGFAVVASEVKLLAAQTAKATDEIGTQIAGMQTATQDSVAAIKEIGGTIGRIAEIANSVAAAVEEQGAATHEISSNVQQAARGTTEVASNIVNVNRGAAETGSASGQVLSAARSLAKESTMLKGEVAKFLATVRAA